MGEQERVLRQQQDLTCAARELPPCRAIITRACMAQVHHGKPHDGVDAASVGRCPRRAQEGRGSDVLGVRGVAASRASALTVQLLPRHCFHAPPQLRCCCRRSVGLGLGFRVMGLGTDFKRLNVSDITKVQPGFAPARVLSLRVALHA